jgi:hypothetical protein
MKACVTVLIFWGVLAFPDSSGELKTSKAVECTSCRTRPEETKSRKLNAIQKGKKKLLFPFAFPFL